MPYPRLRVEVGSNSMLALDPTIPKDTWRLVTVNFLVGSTDGLDIASIYFENLLITSMSWPANPSYFQFSPSDKLVLGGLGSATMYNWRIFSPGSRFVAGIFLDE